MSEEKSIDPNMIWAFSQADQDTKPLLVESINAGKSRFGWSSDDEQNLKREEKGAHYSGSKFLLDIQPGDWIVHINTPKWGKCLACRVTSSYGFDEGLDYGKVARKDFRHFFEVDPNSKIEFDRNNPHFDGKVNLKPRRRYHRIYAISEFVEAIEKINTGVALPTKGQRKQDFQLKKNTEKMLNEITKNIHDQNKGKDLEDFLTIFFNKIPNITVIENGKGWKSDHGADLILIINDPLNLNMEKRVVVQVKSYSGDVYDTKAIDDIKRAYEHYTKIKKIGEISEGIIMTTGTATDGFNNAVAKLTKELTKEELISEETTIRIIDGADFARLILKHAPEMIFDLNLKN